MKSLMPRMPFWIFAAAFFAAEIGAHSAQSLPPFRVAVVESKCPEYGTLIRSSLLSYGNQRIAFQAPAGWGVSISEGEKTITCSAPQDGQVINMKVTLKTNDVAASSSNLPDFAAMILQRIPSALIKAVEVAQVNGVAGKIVHFEYPSKQGRKFGRVAFLTSSGCELEISTAASLSDLKKAHCQFNSLVNSLRVETLQPKE